MHASAFVLALCLGSGLAGATAGASPAQAADEQTAYGPELEGFDYPWPVSYYSFTSQGEKLRMAYMDVKPAGTPNGKTVVLFHGKNFCAATWQGTIAALTAAGYRVIAVDQIGFCKSSKPAHYQFSFQQLAGNTHALLASLGILRVIIIGHSMGGMLGMRYALTFPDDVEQLVLVNPIGLEDWKAKGVPWQSIDGWYQQELKTTADSIRDYQRATYYAGTWDARYEPWVQMLAGLYRGPGHDIVAWNAALTDDMAYTQPVFYEFEKISAPVLLLIGDKDTTAIGKHLASPAVRATLGHYPALAKEAAARFPHAQLVEFPDFGHAPQIQAPDVFHKALLDGLQKKLRLGEDALERYQQALQNAIHLGGDLGGDVSLSQFGGQQIGGALTDICEHGLCPSPCVTVRAFTDATQAQRFQLDGRELRIGMIAQSRKQRERRAVDGLVVGVERS